MMDPQNIIILERSGLILFSQNGEPFSEPAQSGDHLKSSLLANTLYWLQAPFTLEISSFSSVGLLLAQKALTIPVASSLAADSSGHHSFIKLREPMSLILPRCEVKHQLKDKSP